MSSESPAVKSAALGLPSVPVTIAFAVLVGIGSALAGCIEGIVLMVEHTAGTCRDGTADIYCQVHPRLAEGLAISLISLSVGVLVVLLAYVSVAVSRGSNA